MKLLTVYCILGDDEQELFQELFDDSVKIWIDIFVDDGITKCFHLLAAGYVLKKYQGLFIYSQQGLESMNLKCTGYIVQNTLRDGYGTGQNGAKSYIFPLIWYLIKDLWKTGEADHFCVN
jgi:hypothetical protein